MRSEIVLPKLFVFKAKTLLTNIVTASKMR